MSAAAAASRENVLATERHFSSNESLFVKTAAHGRSFNLTSLARGIKMSGKRRQEN